MAITLVRTKLNNFIICLQFMLNPDLLSLEQKKKIKDAFSPLLQRDILPLEDEFRDEDRIHFEQTVLRSYDLGEHYEKVTNSLLSIHRT
ncbi:hypothetical protein [Lysinibacillus sp. BF-4]|uniref:hypothetical protein n=1 Tax=Lysinibacillus sp. BF-4 TaxID=1473546 RepID=UPI001268D3DC|nr:hypothetical protein [Lysinibacillus sp. BF-4]